ncbi:MAG: hypothetical protein JNM00_11070, partial [Flavobacteriales bacterium]|nr:hypothetical protein [Flavobacteriales bacterium]
DEVEIHQNPEDIEFEIEGLVDGLERFKQAKAEEEQQVKQAKKGLSGTQGSLF